MCLQNINVFLVMWLVNAVEKTPRGPAVFTIATTPTSSPVTTAPLVHDPYLPAHLAERLHALCPYADICGMSATREIPSPAVLSCCRPCSCAADCGATLSCCFPELDEYKLVEKYGMKCTSTSLEPKILRATSYYMIDTCLNEPETDCSSVVNSEGYLHPVYSPATGVTYYNKLCAECNGVTDGIVWNYYMRCDPLRLNDTVLLKPSIANIDYVTGVDFDRVCDIVYLPPEDIDVYSHVCVNEKIIDACNDTGRADPYPQETIDACMNNINVMFHHPYSNNIFVNPFCYSCSALIDDRYNADQLCEALDVVPRFPTTFTMVIKGDFDVTAFTAPLAPPTHQNSGCEKFYVPHVTRQDDCRVLFCPIGQIRIGNKCRYYSSRWDAAVVVVRLVLTSSDHLPLDVLLQLKGQSDHSWLKATGIKKWKYVNVLYNVDTTDDSVKHVFVWLGRDYQSGYFNPITLFKSLDTTINGEWKIETEDSNYQFSAEIDAEGAYIQVNDGYLPVRYFYDYIDNMTLESDWMLLSLSRNFEGDLFIPLAVTPLYFCQRVQLREDEFEWLGDDANRRVRIVDTGRILKAAAYSHANDDMGGKVIRVCVDDFNPNWDTQGYMLSEGYTTHTSAIDSVVVVTFVVMIVELYALYYG